MTLPQYRRIGPGATESGHARFAVVDAVLLAQKALDAAGSPRLRDMCLSGQLVAAYCRLTSAGVPLHG